MLPMATSAILFAYVTLAVVVVFYAVRVNFLRRHPVSVPSPRRSKILVVLAVSAAGIGIGIGLATDRSGPSLAGILFSILTLIGVAGFAYWRFTPSSSSRDGRN